MNYIDLFFIVVFLVMIFAGYLKGFIVSVLSLVRFAVAFPLSFFLADKYSSLIYTSLCRDIIQNSVFAEIEKSGVEGSVEAIRDFLENLPFGLSDSVNFSFLNGGREELVQGIMKNAVDPAAEIIVKIAVFVLTIIVFYVITWLIIRYFKKRSDDKDSPFHKTNKFLGAVLGLIKAVLFVFTASAILYFILNISGKNAFVNEIETSFVYNFIVKYNPIVIYLIGE